MDELIIFENVTYRYLESDVEAVSDIQFSVPKSQWLSIVGRNGSGKSTIGKLMNGLVRIVHTLSTQLRLRIQVLRY